MNDDKKTNQDDLNVEQAIDDIFDEKTNKEKEENLSNTSLNINAINSDGFDYSKVQDEIEINTSSNDEIDRDDNGSSNNEKVLSFMNNNFESKESSNDENNKSEGKNLSNDLENNDISINTESSDNSIKEEVDDVTYSSINYNTPIETENETPKKNKKLLYLIIGAILIAILIIVLCLLSINCEKKTSCSYASEDSNYKITDNYKITYKKDKILYVSGNYSYSAKTKNYEDQISIIRQEKIPAMVNSNAMDGFTYVLNEGEDNFSMTSSLDFTAFNYDEISKIDQKVKPISYFEIDSKLTYGKLKKILEDQGYTCKSI